MISNDSKFKEHELLQHTTYNGSVLVCQNMPFYNNYL